MRFSHAAIAAIAALAMLVSSEASRAQTSVPLNVGEYELDSTISGNSYGVIGGYLYMGGRGLDMGFAYWNNYFVLDLTQIPAGVSITAATLSITEMLPVGSPGAFSLCSCNLSPSFVLESSPSQADMQTSYNGLAGGTNLLSSAQYSVDQAQPSTDDLSATGNSTFLNLLNSNIGSTMVVGANVVATGRFDGGSPVFTVTTSPVPEPSSVALIAAGTAAFIGFASRRRR